LLSNGFLRFSKPLPDRTGESRGVILSWARNRRPKGRERTSGEEEEVERLVTPARGRDRKGDRGGSAGLEESGLRGLVPAPDDERLRETVASFVEAGGGHVAAILLYGSRVQRSSPDRWSAYDFFVLTDAYGPLFRALGPKGHSSRSPWVLTFFSHFLPPNIISFGESETGLPMAKCAIVNPRHLQGFLGRHSRDHFLKGRAVQKLALVWSRSNRDESGVVSALRVAREGIVYWVRPFLETGFDLETFAWTMLKVSYRGEIRPEASDRVEEVFASQRQVLMDIARESLDSAVRKGLARMDGGRYYWVRPPGILSRAGYSLYFTFSKTRATLRWFKYVVTFDRWIDYIIRKIHRRAGFEVSATKWERRWPFLFLWPKFFRVIWALSKVGPRTGTDEEKGEDS
jgi:hypothetical protein